MKGKFCVDIRESQSRIDGVREAFSDDIEVRVEVFQVADYFWKNKLGIEHKTAKDFIGSIKDERLFQQAEELKENFTHAIILVSSTYEELLAAPRGMNPESLRGAVASLFTRRGVPVFFVGDEKEFARTAFRLWKKASKGGPIDYTPVRKSSTTKDSQKHLLRSLPEVGEKKADRLLEEYGSPLKAIRAYKRWEDEVHGFGEETTGKIKDVLESIR